MKDELIQKYLFDILDSIHAIQDFIHGVHEYKEFISSRLLKSGVERELQVISEALDKALKINKDLSVTEAKKIKATRNIIVHDYDGINYRIIWNIIKDDLPKLEDEVKRILNQSDSQ